MTEVKVLVRFRGVNFSEIYEKDKTYHFEDARAKSLASQGLVKIVEGITETAETVAEDKDTDNEVETVEGTEQTMVEATEDNAKEDAEEEKTEETKSKRGRKSSK